MSTVVLKLFAGQDTGRTDGRMDRQSSDYMLPHLGSIIKLFINTYYFRRKNSHCMLTSFMVQTT